MSADQKKNPLTPHFRVSFPRVFKAELNDLNGKMEYSVLALFPKGTDLTKLKEAATEAIKKKWGEDTKKWPQNLKSPFRKHEERAKTDEVTGKLIYPAGHEEGGIFMTLKSSQKPGLVNQRREPIIDDAEFYAGCWAHASVRAYAYDAKGNKGVAFGLQNIQKVKDGDPLSGRASVEEEFAPLEEAETKSSSADLFN